MSRGPTPKYPEDLKALAEEALLNYFPKTDNRIDPVREAMAYCLFSPGKRFRPVLTLLSAEAVGGDPRAALPVACAIEFIHTYSLIHDDLPAIDNDDLRRGRPTCHVRFGEDIAILAGDALFAEAFVLILNGQEKFTSGERLIKVLREIAVATGINGMVGGQVVDVISTGKDIDLATLEFMHNHKTGSLITASARCGAIIGGGSDKQLKAMTRYAGELGLAFQIIDDILDIVGSAQAVGKPVGSDADKNKLTFPSKLGVDKSMEKARNITDKAIAALTGAGLREDRLAELARFVVTRVS